MRHKTEAHIDKTKSIPMDEIGKHAGIELASERMLEEEAFSNEMLEIEVHPSGEEGSLDIITPCVNGINQPIVRGRRATVKRKYVEALARSRTTKYTQELGDFRDPASLRMVEKTVLTYPFVIHHDPNPLGREWIKGILES